MFRDKKELPIVAVDVINGCHVGVLYARKDPGLLQYIVAIKLSDIDNPKKKRSMFCEKTLIKLFNIVVIIPGASEQYSEYSIEREGCCWLCTAWVDSLSGI